MMIFACDLDNTLIYSQKKELPVPKSCVEIYRGEPITYMTDATAGLLGQMAAQAVFVPVTTRTLEQYRRISLPVEAPYALVCNGGVLLKQGVEVPEWYQETKRLVEPSRMELQKGEKLLTTDVNRSFELRRIQELFLFTKSDNPPATVAYLKENLDTDIVDIYANGAKIYVLPRQLTKGNAVLRLKEYLEKKAPEKIEKIAVVAAGDSEFDISMIEAADIGYVPEELAGAHTFPSTVHCLKEEAGVFSEKLLREAAKYLQT